MIYINNKCYKRFDGAYDISNPITKKVKLNCLQHYLRRSKPELFASLILSLDKQIKHTWLKKKYRGQKIQRTIVIRKRGKNLESIVEGISILPKAYVWPWLKLIIGVILTKFKKISLQYRLVGWSQKWRCTKKIQNFRSSYIHTLYFSKN